MAMGHGLPVISTPTGGLVEQVTDGVNGIVARAATAASLADAINQFASDGSLRQRLRENIASVAQQRSFGVFSDRLVSLVNQRAPACPS
jgi:glycosyltransferase involved in cell wall biosynthesis